MAPVRLNVLTYNRPRLLLEVLAQIPDAVELVVFDDGSTEDYSDVAVAVATRGGRLVRARRNHGKRLFGRWLETVHADSLASDATRFITLPDDMFACTDFIGRACALWDAIDDERKVAMSLHRDRRESCWGSGPPRDCGDVRLMGWIDGAFLCEAAYYRMVENRSFRVVRNWSRQPHLGSGAYQLLSNYLRSRGAHLYGVKRSLLRHMDVPSQMNPEARAVDPLTTVDFIDDVSDEPLSHAVPHSG